MKAFVSVTAYTKPAHEIILLTAGACIVQEMTGAAQVDAAKKMKTSNLPAPLAEEIRKLATAGPELSEVQPKKKARVK